MHDLQVERSTLVFTLGKLEQGLLQLTLVLMMCCSPWCAMAPPPFDPPSSPSPGPGGCSAPWRRGLAFPYFIKAGGSETDLGLSLALWVRLVLMVPAPSLYIHLYFLAVCPADLKLRHKTQRRQPCRLRSLLPQLRETNPLQQTSY